VIDLEKKEESILGSVMVFGAFFKFLVHLYFQVQDYELRFYLVIILNI